MSSYVGVNDVRDGDRPSSVGKTDGSLGADEFKNRRNAFESIYNDSGDPGRNRGVRELMLTKNQEFGLSFGRPSSSTSYTSEKDAPMDPVRSSSSQSWGHHMPHPLTGTTDSPGGHVQSPLNQQRYIDEDDDGLGVSSSRRPHPQQQQTGSRHQDPHAALGSPGGVAITGEGGGRREDSIGVVGVMGVGMGGRPSPQSYLRHRDSAEENEREDPGLSHQIEFLTAKNRQLQKQLEEREVERNRLREQLETQRGDKVWRQVCSPPGLPSRVLDGRKVLTSPGIPTSTPTSPHPQSQSPLLLQPAPTSPLRVHSPPVVSQLHNLSYTHHHQHNQPPRAVSPLPQAPQSPRYQQQIGSAGAGEVGEVPGGSPSQRRPAVDGYPPPPRRDTPTSPLSTVSTTTKQYFQQIEDLKRENRDLEKKLREVLDEKRRLENDLNVKKESFLKMQAREQDLSKDIELLRDENSHHTSAIKRLQTERDGLKTENESLHDEMTSLNDKLNKTENCYKEVEHENLSLEAEIEQLVADKKQLNEEKQKLQTVVEGDLKTKESFRSTIKQLRMDNQSLEDSMRTNRAPGSVASNGGGATSTGRQKKMPEPPTVAQKTLSEVLDLREEKLALQGKLRSTQQEIDSLEAHLKFDGIGEVVQRSHTSPEVLEGASREEELQLHFSYFHSHISRLKVELESVRGDVTTSGSNQQALVHDSFMELVKKCRELLCTAENDKTLLSENLQMAELHLSKVMTDFDILKQENTKLQLQRNEVLDDVNRLKGDVSTLRDKGKMLAARLTQSEAIAVEKEEQLSTLKSEKTQIEDRYHTSEKNWKKVVDKLQQDFDDKVSELTQQVELLTEERDCLCQEKDLLESKLSQLTLENEKLEIVRDAHELRLRGMEERMLEITDEINFSQGQIERAQIEIARLLVQKVCLSAQMTVTEETLENKMEEVHEKSRNLIIESNSERDGLKEALRNLESEKNGLVDKLSEMIKKEQHIDMLECKVCSLKKNQGEMQSEMDVLTKKHGSVVQEFQALEETQHKQRIEYEKLKMTLTTEIKLLRSKVSSVESDRQRLEEELSEVNRKKALESVQQGKIFQGMQSFTAAGDVGGALSKNQGESKQHQKLRAVHTLPADASLNLGRLDGKVSELQNRVNMLEKENKMLREIAKKTAPPTSAAASLGTAAASYSPLDEEMLASLQKKSVEMNRKIYFLEADKQHLMEKVKALSTSLKVTRESKSKLSSEHAQKVQAENSVLQEKMAKLKEALTRKLMAADSKIIETVSENDVLKEKLKQIQSTLTTPGEEGSGLFGCDSQALDAMKKDVELLQELKSSLSTSSVQLEKLESAEKKMEDLQQELQQLYLSESGGSSSNNSSSSSSSSRSVPSVFKSLPAGYLSNFQHRRGSGSSSSKSDSKSSVPSSSSSPELQKKVSEMASATVEFKEALKSHKSYLSTKETDIEAILDRLDSFCDKLKEGDSSRSKSVEAVLESLEGVELRGVQLAREMKRQIETLQDQVMVRDSALADIEMSMKADYDAHHRKFTQVKSQVLELREQLSSTRDQLCIKDHYVHLSEDKCLSMEAELLKVRKELEAIVQGHRDYLRQAGVQVDKMKLQGVGGVTRIIHMQREEISRLQKGVRDFSCDLSRTQSQLEAMQREKTMLLSKSLDLEKLHVQMKEQMAADINYLRQLNLQMVERQFKADKEGSEILKEVMAAKCSFQKQKDIMKMESELNEAKIQLSKQTNVIQELESHLNSQCITIKLLQAEKEHSIPLQHHVPPERTNQTSRSSMRPRSADTVFRTPKYKISDKTSRGGGTLGHKLGNFSIPLPSQDSRHGYMEILDLEEQPDSSASLQTMSLGPTVVTDDEYGGVQEVEKAAAIKPLRLQLRTKARHQRTVSMGSNFVSSPKDKDMSKVMGVSSLGGSSCKPKLLAGVSKTLPSRQLQSQTSLQLSMRGLMMGGNFDQEVSEEVDLDADTKRPDSAVSNCSTLQIFPGQNSNASTLGGGLNSVVPSAAEEGFHDYSPTPVNKGFQDDSLSGNTGSDTTGVTGKDSNDCESYGRNLAKGNNSALLGVALGSDGKAEGGRYDTAGLLKPINKSTDSNETTSSEGNGFSSKSSSQSDSSAGVMMGRGPLTRNNPKHTRESAKQTDLSRTASISSTSTTSSYYSNFPSRNESFNGYNGGEESSTHEVLEIADSEENLQYLGRKIWFTPITTHRPDTTSSSDEESFHKNNYRKKSANTGDNTPRHRDRSYPGSNSSGESDTLGGDRGERTRLADIPAHVNESISVSDMDREATDVEIESKAHTLQKIFDSSQKHKRVHHSSSGSVKICYSGSSLEDVSKN